MKKLIYLVAGARPNFMKIAPIIRELKRRKMQFDFKLVHTGQHYDTGMSGVFFKELAIPEPDYYLDVSGGTQAEQVAKIMVRFETICTNKKPDIVLVVGDVNSTLACAIVAKKLQICLVHVEAGLRSGDQKMPEEINRIVTDSITDIFFVTEQSALENLRKEGHAQDDIHFVGNVMIDNLLYQLKQLEAGSVQFTCSEKLKGEHKKYGVVTIHRPGNVDNLDHLALVVKILNEISEKIPLIFPIHPRTRKNLEGSGIAISQNIIQLDPLSYMDFLNLVRDAKFICTDSGGIQDETTVLGIPCLTFRNSTERPVTVEKGTNLLVPLQIESINQEIDRILKGDSKKGVIPKFWDGEASARILDILLQKNLV